MSSPLASWQSELVETGVSRVVRTIDCMIHESVYRALALALALTLLVSGREGKGKARQGKERRGNGITLP